MSQPCSKTFFMKCFLLLVCMGSKMCSASIPTLWQYKIIIIRYPNIRTRIIIIIHSIAFHYSIPLPITLSAGTQALTAQQTYLGGTCGTPSAGQCGQPPLASHTEPWPALSSWGRGGSATTPSARIGKKNPAWSEAFPGSDLGYGSWSLPPAQCGDS